MEVPEEVAVVAAEVDTIEMEIEEVMVAAVAAAAAVMIKVIISPS